MRIALSLVLASALTAAVVSTSARADPVLPQGTISVTALTANGSNTIVVYNNNSEAISTTTFLQESTSFAQADAWVNGGASPSIGFSASVTASPDPWLSGSSSTSIRYSYGFEFLSSGSLTPTSVPLLFSMSTSATYSGSKTDNSIFSGYSNSYSAGVSIGLACGVNAFCAQSSPYAQLKAGSTDGVVYQDDSYQTINYPQGAYGGGALQSIFYVKPNQVIPVTLFMDAGTHAYAWNAPGYPYYAVGHGSGTLSVTVDPTITIDPTWLSNNPGQGQLVFFTVPSPVSEPSTLLLMGFGLSGGLFRFFRQSRRRWTSSARVPE